MRPRLGSCEGAGSLLWPEDTDKGGTYQSWQLEGITCKQVCTWVMGDSEPGIFG